MVKSEDMILPTPQQLEEELERTKYRKRYRRVLRSTVYTLISVAAIAVLVATLLLPVLQIYGSSMVATLSVRDIVLTLKTSDFETGDVIAFYYNNKILIKRVIAHAGDWVDISQEGDVYINGELLDEPYLDAKAFGDCNIELPYQVPESRIFVMGDHRSVSVDSRNTAVGCVSEEQIVGKLIFRIWPMDSFGEIN
jgi:signal peptidase I